MPEKENRFFGRVIVAEPKEQNEIETLVKDYPLSVFQALNKRLNERGFCIFLSLIDED